MKKLSIGLKLLAISGLLWQSGCVGLQVGGGTKNQTQQATVGQQLIDLQKAKEAGVINDTEFQQQKAKLLGKN